MSTLTMKVCGMEVDVYSYYPVCGWIWMKCMNVAGVKSSYRCS